MNVFRVTRILIFLMVTVLLFIPHQLIKAQIPPCINDPDLQVVPLASVNLGDLIVAGEIQNNTLFMSVFIQTDVPIQVILEGIIDVRFPGDEVFSRVGSFTTAPFPVDPPGRNVLNTEFASVIPIESAVGETAVLDRLRDLGRPAGAIQITLNATNVATQIPCGTAVHIESDITNPEQILRTSPADGSQQQQENTVISWVGDVGFAEYLLTVNDRKPGQSPEDALDTNAPPIVSASTGTATNVNLRDLALQRQILPGSELVWQVTGVIPGVGGGSQISSDIGSFFIYDPNSALMTTILSRLILLLQQLGDFEAASLFQGGEITLTGEFQLQDGSVLTLQELMNLLSYLESNPDQIINVGVE